MTDFDTTPAETPAKTKTPAWIWFPIAALVLAVAAVTIVGLEWADASDDLDDARADVTQLHQRLAAAKATAKEQTTRAVEADAHATELDERLAEFRTNVERFFVLAAEADGESPEAARCYVEKLGGEDLVASAITALENGMQGTDADLVGAVATAQASCAEFGPQQPGDDPVLDALHAGCAGGDGDACDELYFTAPHGSEYERFGLTCGDRFAAADAPELCEGAI